MTSVNDLLLAYKKNNNLRFTSGGKDINVYYLSNDESSGDEFIGSKEKTTSNSKLECNISKYIKKAKHVKK